jgi:hypothetical protein
VTQTLKDTKRPINLAIRDRRRGKRLFLNYSVEISGVDEEGRTFVERTKTEDISETGCRFHTHVPLRCGDRLEIKMLPPVGLSFTEELTQQFEVMWVEEDDKGWSVGACKSTKGKIWKVSFPPPKSPHDPRSK